MMMTKMDLTATSAVFGWDRSDVAEYRQGAPRARVPFNAACPLCTGDRSDRALCDAHADELSRLTFSAEELEAAAAR